MIFANDLDKCLICKTKGAETQMFGGNSQGVWGVRSPGERGFREIFVNVYLKNEFLCISEPCISNFKFLDSYNNKKKGWRLMW